MAGRGHHYLPKYLQKGFAHEIKGKNVRTWQYRRELPPPEQHTNITNIGKETYFYGDPGKIDADPAITELEGVHAPIVDRLRALPNGANANEELLPEIITNLTLRSASLRESMTDVMRVAIKTAFGTISDCELTLENEIRKHYPSASRDEINRRKALLAPVAFEPAKQLRETTIKELESAIRNGQNNALSAGPSLTALSGACRCLSWTVHTSVDDSLILGDTPCLYRVGKHAELRPYSRAEGIELVVLPISSSRFVVGCSDGTAAGSTRADEINRAQASCAAAFFISSMRLPRDSELPGLIGLTAGILSPERIAGLCDDVASYRRGLISGRGNRRSARASKRRRGR